MPEKPVEPQAVLSPNARYAIFIVATLNPGADNAAAVRAWCEDVGNLVSPRTVGTRAVAADLSCVCGFGSAAWDALFGRAPRPAGLHPFREIGTGERVAVWSTPGDILLHIRAEAMDACFELATLLVAALGSAATVVDREVHGFTCRYFDRRAIIGFVDGTENPQGFELPGYTLIGDEDEAFAGGGSYVLVQKYLHDMSAWEKLSTEQQELIIGRRKLTNVELPDDVKPSYSHSALTTLEEDGQEIKIAFLRDNMPFGRAGAGEFGTYFIGYARSPKPIEQMLENMFVGRPAGNYDRLDYSRAVTGSLFFVPSAELLDELAERAG
uniref:Peroxidase n=1 Tax=Alcaligenes xylosoxydans xylosoxydans TaxID=85698 RepID=A0A0G3Y4R7_ALCXX|nr:peroxidase [Achromobacter xylosoxidans]